MRKVNVPTLEQPTHVFQIHNCDHKHIFALKCHLLLMQTLNRI
jgi:hypothetical protein